jgi:hypothetical protein
MGDEDMTSLLKTGSAIGRGMAPHPLDKKLFGRKRRIVRRISKYLKTNLALF